MSLEQQLPTFALLSREAPHSHSSQEYRSYHITSNDKITHHRKHHDPRSAHQLRRRQQGHDSLPGADHCYRQPPPHRTNAPYRLRADAGDRDLRARHAHLADQLSRRQDLSEQTKEEPNYEALGDGRTFATWQEASGEVVAQIVDLKAQQVTAFIYAPLIEGQTSRSATRLTGKITQQ